MSYEQETVQSFDDILKESILADKLLAKSERSKKATRISGVAAASAISLALTLTLAFNEESVRDAVSVATSDNEYDHEVSEVASLLAGSPVYVNCDDSPLNKLDKADPLIEGDKRYIREAIVRKVTLPYGLSFFPPITTMREGLCSTLTEYNPTPPANMSDTDAASLEYFDKTKSFAKSVYVLLHEIEHTKEISNEAEASCYGFQKLPDALGKLGVNETFIYSIPELIAYEESHTAMEEYLSDECKPGGQYDLAIDGTYLIKPEPVLPRSFADASQMLATPKS